MLTGLFIACLSLGSSEPAPPSDATTPHASAEQAVERATRYLAREVPRWRPENKCASCHNNGDGARALILASAVGRTSQSARSLDPVLANTLDWLTHPDRWDDNGGEGPFNDRQLADIQFSFALVAAIEAKLIEDRELMVAAARRVAGHQRSDGSWQVVPEGTLGTPATYGNVLATVVSHGAMSDAHSSEFKDALARAEQWLSAQRPKTVLDAAALLAAPRFRADDEQRAACLKVLQAGAAETGGWGPYVTSPPEPFDTALALIGLSRSKGAARKDGREWTEFDDEIGRAREFLVTLQLSDGSWPETTRPPGAESYAQRVSTTAWAAMALLLIAPPPE
jgi:hypothetical protein